MPLATNSAWDAKTAAIAKKPIYVFEIGGQTTVYTTHDLTREGVTGTLPAYEPWLKVPQGASASIDVQGGTSSIGELVCEVVDHGGAIRTLVGSTTLEGSSATLKVGYPGIAITEFVVLHSYVLYKILPTRGYASYEFTSKDVQLDGKRTVWYHPLNGEVLSEANPWVLQGTPCELIQAVWLLGLGNTAASIDRTGMAALDSDAEGLFCASRPFRFSMTKPFGAKQFIENEICKASGLYPVVNNVGQYGVRAFRAPAAGPDPVFAFTADNVCVLPDFDRAPILNNMIFQFDDDGTGSYGRKLVFLEATSISTFQRSNTRQVQSAGLRTLLGADWFCQEIARRMFNRFAGTVLRGGAPLMSVEAFYATLPVWVGDYVTLSHPKMPDLLTGAEGVTDRVYEVVNREPNYARGRISYQLLDTGLTGAPAAAQYGTAVIGTATYY